MDHPGVHFVIALALIQYFGFCIVVGQARVRYGVPAPAITGHPEFERRFRVQQNTLEQLVVFIPAMLLFATWVSATLAGVLGLVFILGRWLYFRGYVADAERRGTGFMVGALAQMALLLGAVLGSLVAAL
ncbi:MAG: MAPEG family protein [Pseudomonadales bacterium]|nr:MAPEG family protein [Pseudomonadales bacterium]